MIWQSRPHAFTPNWCAISGIGLPLPASARMKKAFIFREGKLARDRSRRPRAGVGLRFAEEEGEEHDAFREGGAQDRLDQNLRGRSGIAPDGLRSFCANKADADGRAE